MLAKQNDISTPEVFAAILGEHFVSTYPHIHAAHVKIIVHRWTRLEVNGKPHPHSFFRDGAEIRTVEAVAREGEGISIKSGIEKLLVLKSTGSAFYGFHRDEYTRLPETWDRILSTEVEAEWQWNTFKSLAEVKQKEKIFDQAHTDARKITVETFATENSPSVQNTMYKMSEQILEKAQEVQSVSYKLPNKHYFEIGEFAICGSDEMMQVKRANTTVADLSWYKGLKNTGKDAEVFAPQSDPNGLIQSTVHRKGQAKSKL